jgi:hypothetical protein
MRHEGTTCEHEKWLVWGATNHVEVNVSSSGLDAEHGVHHNRCEHVGYTDVNLGAKGCLRHVEQHCAVNTASALQRVKNLESLNLGNVKAISDDAWVQSLVDPPFRLLQHLPNHDHV